MTVRVYRSTDASAPVLTGQVGSLTALLDAILVNGYGALSAAGWTIVQTTTNKRGYKQNVTGANNPSGMCLYVDDTGPGAGAAREARVCGFETMSAITPTGTGQFPTAAQSTIGIGALVIRKSTTADATARPWTCIANGQTFYLFIESGDTLANPIATTTFVFGDIKAYKPSDQYAVIIIGRQIENSGNAVGDPLHCIQLAQQPNMAVMNTTMFGHFMARSWTGIGGSIRVGKPFDHSRFITGNNLYGQYANETQVQVNTVNGIGLCLGRNAYVQQWPAPNGADGSLALAPVYICHNWALRGYLPGLWHPLHDRPLGHNDTITVVGGNMNGKSLVAQNIQAYINFSANGEAGQVLAETSDTWT
jgi:hypothetical protein